MSINNIAGQSDLLDNIAIFSAEYFPFLFIAALLYLWFAAKQDGKENGLFAFYAVIIALSINWLIGVFYFQPRPFVAGIGIQLIHHDADASFPSDHTTFLISIALMLSLLKETRKLGSLLFLFAMMGGIARIFCGVHYPLDIIGSLLTSAMASFIVLYFKNTFNQLNLVFIHLYHHILETMTHTLIDKTHVLHLSFLPKNKHH